jgi:hypothetical protein
MDVPPSNKGIVLKNKQKTIENNVAENTQGTSLLTTKKQGSISAK